MSDLFEKAANILLQYGLAGVCIIVLLLACRNLFNKYCTVQEKRIEENSAAKTALAENTNALSRLTDAMQKNH